MPSAGRIFYVLCNLSISFLYLLSHSCHQDGRKNSRKRAFISIEDESAVDRKDKKRKAEHGGLESDEDMEGSGEAIRDFDDEMNNFGRARVVSQTGNAEDTEADENGNREDEDVDQAGDLSETVCYICDNGGEVTG
jgi:hypothetical protein